ncbi:hypothetical protein TNCV_3527961 [Trichonephila clavipes]|nr:hypothetical protein TNCV_3527961 [Trichonephila clavipes]
MPPRCDACTNQTRSGGVRELSSVVVDATIAKMPKTSYRSCFSRKSCPYKVDRNIHTSKAPFTWVKIEGNMPDRIRFLPVYTTNRHFAGSKCRSKFHTLL